MDEPPLLEPKNIDASLLDSHLKLFQLHQEQLTLLTHQLTGLSTVQQVLIEILVSVSPEQKKAVVDALSQILARPELLPNQYAKQMLAEIHNVASRPSRTSPEGRRSWLHLVSAPDSEKQKP